MDASRHEIDVWVDVPCPMPNGWRWGNWDRVNPVGREPVSSADEAGAVLRVFGRAVALVLKRSVAERFTVTAYLAETNRVVGRDQWEWDARVGLYFPHGEPWCPGLAA